jgi:hypothetical protein
MKIELDSRFNVGFPVIFCFRDFGVKLTGGFQVIEKVRFLYLISLFSTSLYCAWRIAKISIAAQGKVIRLLVMLKNSFTARRRHAIM